MRVVAAPLEAARRDVGRCGGFRSRRSPAAAGSSSDRLRRKVPVDRLTSWSLPSITVASA